MCQASWWGFSSGSVVMNPCAMQEMQETWVQSLGWENPLEEGMVNLFSILVWEIPWREESGRLQSWSRKESDEWSDQASPLIRLLDDWRNDCPWTMGKKSLIVWEVGVWVVECTRSLEILLEGNHGHGHFQNHKRLVIVWDMKKRHSDSDISFLYKF